MTGWTTAADISRRLERYWTRGDMLAARITGESPFPLELRLRGPSARQITDRFGEVMDWIAALRAGSRERLGHGYDLRFETRRNRVHGDNAIPVAAVIPGEGDALRLLRRGADAERFQRAAGATLTRLPELRA